MAEMALAVYMTSRVAVRRMSQYYNVIPWETINCNALTRRQFSRRFEPELINRQPVHVLGYIILLLLLLGHVRPQQRIHVLGMPEAQEHEEQDKGAHQLKWGHNL